MEGKNNTHKVVGEPMISMDESVRVLAKRYYSAGDYAYLSTLIYGTVSKSRGVEMMIARLRGRKTAVKIIAAYYRNKEKLVAEIEKIKSGK